MKTRFRSSFYKISLRRQNYFLLLAFFSYSIRKPKDFWEKRKNLDATHLLDLIRKTYNIPNNPHQTKEQSSTDLCCCSRENTCFNILSHTKNKTQADTPTPPLIYHGFYGFSP
uniref:Uncharacterized protein n=1 Tax=Noccaea caerulescens TaxID=107243 RepID=A0A1J3FBX8_NOCCA